MFCWIAAERSSALCQEVVVRIHHSNGIFTTRDDVHRAIAAIGMPVVGEPLSSIDLKRIEQAVRTLPYYKEILVYTSVQNHVVVECTERNALMRLIDRDGKQALLDAEGCVFPLPAGPSPRLPVLSLAFPMAAQAQDAEQMLQCDTGPQWLHEAFAYANLLYRDPFLLMQFQQTLLKADGELVVYPQVGNHTISLGTMQHMDEKINNLKMFYQKGIDEATWNSFADINLKYKDQIVCTKK